MRTMLAVTCAVFAVQGCKSQKVLAAETELAAAKARLVTLEKRRGELNAEARRLQVERNTHTHQADEAGLARERLGAALAVLGGQPVPDGIQLDEALRAKSPKLGALAAAIVQRQLPCVDADAETPEEDEGGPECSPPPLDDACAGVEERGTQSLKWNCQAVVATPNAPASAVCVSPAELNDSVYPLIVPTRHVEADVVRLAFEKKGRLIVADWPPPQLELYRPENWSELATCANENSDAQCIRSCDERHGRLQGGCDQWGDSDEGEGGDDEENPEPSELRAAREAAARAEREAAEARDELSYQECLAGCGGGEATDPEPIARVSLSYTRTPAPGLFQFDVDLEGEDGGVPPHTLLIGFPALFEELGGGVTPPADDTVGELTTALDVVKLLEGKPVDGKRVFAGVTPEGRPMGVRVSLDGKTAPEALELDEVCGFAEHLAEKSLVESCAVAKAQREGERAKAAAKAAKADAGVKPDAGSQPPDAGVTP